jgi:hypothetical protein
MVVNIVVPVCGNLEITDIIRAKLTKKRHTTFVCGKMR